MKKYLFVLILISLSKLFSLEPVIINDKTESIQIGKYLEVFEDPSCELTIEDIIKPEYQNKFILSDDNRVNKGKSQSVFWFKLKILVTENINDSLILESTWPLYDVINIYYKDDDVLIKKYYGNIFPFNQREINSINFSFEIPYEIMKVKEIYISIKTDTSVQLPLKVHKKEIFLEKEKFELILFGLFIGIFLVMIVYNLILYIFIKDFSYLFYVIYEFTYLLFQLSYLGFSYKYFWPENLWFSLHSMPLFLGLGMMCYLLYSQIFLKIKLYSKILNLIFYVFEIIILVFTLLTLYTIFTPLKIINFLGIFTLFLILFGSIFVLVKGNKSARYFLIGWSFFIIGSLLVTLKAVGYVSNNIITSYPMQIGSIFEVILLSIALSDRYNIMKKEKEDSQQLALETQTKLKSEAERRLKITEIYTRRSIVEKIEKGEDPTNYKPENKRITILFSDIRDFTTISENLSAIETVELLNSYFNEMNDCIMQLGGEIDKLIGDCIMALFDDPDKSIHSAIQMREKLITFNLQNKTKLRVNNGIGINYGEVVLGNIGSKTKMDYTVIGDIVNSASRIESLTKYYGLPIIISEELKNSLKENYKIRFIDEVLVKGKKQPTRIYEVFDYEKPEITEMKYNYNDELIKTFDLYKQGNFQETIKIYKKLIGKAKNHSYLKNKCSDPLLNFYLDRCIKLQEQKEAGLLDNWNGVYEFLDK